MQVHATDQAAAECAGDVLVLPIYSHGELTPTAADAARTSGRDLKAIANRFRLRKPGDQCWVPTAGALGCDDILLLCVGEHGADGVTAGDMRTAVMRAAKTIGRANVVASLADVPVVGRDAAEIVAEAIVIGSYTFDRYRTLPARQPSVQQLTLPGARDSSAQAGLAIGEATNLARDLTNSTPADVTPEAFARICEEQAGRLGFHCHALYLDDLRAGGFGGIVGVGAGSPNPPVLVCLETGDDSQPATALAGKGITFDSGGLDIKELSWMLQMKDDMAGCAAILAAMTALPALGLTPHIRAYLALAENAISGDSTRPGDVLRHRGGRTTEVISPDAEGRLVLADAITYAGEHSPARIIDVATLTGSTGLGPEVWGIMGNHQPLVDALLTAGLDSGEPGWQLPLWEGYRKNLRSDIADLRNQQMGVQWNHAAIWAGLYLSEFIGRHDWAHIDVGATVLRAEPDDTWITGATGSGTRTLIQYFRLDAAAASAL
jgi:leucyl aminopeptidase